MCEFIGTFKEAKTSFAETGIQGSRLDCNNQLPPRTTTLFRGYQAFKSRGKDDDGNPLEPDFDEMCDHLLDGERRQALPEEDTKNTKAMKANGQGHSYGQSQSDGQDQRPRNGDHNEPKCVECER